MAEIQNALNAGKEVITHTDAVSVPGWSGAGYIITDPVTGDGAYKISGGGNGGAYALGYAHGLTLGLLAAGLAWSLIYPPLASIFAALLVIWLASFVAAMIAVYSILDEDGVMCFGAGLLWGFENGLIAMGFVPGMGGYTIITELVIGSLGQLIDFPTMIQCNVFE